MRHIDGDASWTHMFYFYSFALLVGGCLLLPLTLTLISTIWSSEVSMLFLDMPWSKRILLCFIMSGIAFFGFGTELRSFSVGRYLIGSVLFALMMWKYALQGSLGAPILIPIGSGLIGLAYVWALGNLGISFCNWVEKSTGRKGLYISNAAVIIAAISTIILVLNLDKKIGKGRPESLSGTSVIERAPSTSSDSAADITSPAQSEVEPDLPIAPSEN